MNVKALSRAINREDTKDAKFFFLLKIGFLRGLRGDFINREDTKDAKFFLSVEDWFSSRSSVSSRSSR